MNYLIIDDDEIFADALTRTIVRAGHGGATAYDASSAFHQISSLSPDRIILDLKLGTDSGLLLLPELKTRAPNAEILLLTGYSSIPTAVDAIKLGAVNYLCKPADFSEIEAAFSNRDRTDSSSAAISETPLSVERLEWEHIQRVLAGNNGNISATARALGMHRRTLQRKLSKRPASH